MNSRCAIFNSFINNNFSNKIHYLKYTDKQFNPWEIKQEKLNAFYIENDEYILEYPTDPYAIHEYEKRRNVVDIVVKSYFK